MKTCIQRHYCIYQKHLIEITDDECSYEGYCDYQLPRDSRPNQIEDETGKSLKPPYNTGDPIPPDSHTESKGGTK